MELVGEKPGWPVGVMGICPKQLGFKGAGGPRKSLGAGPGSTPLLSTSSAPPACPDFSARDVNRD